MTEHDARVWADVLAYLRAHYPADCRQWFDELTAAGLDAASLRVRTRSTVHRDYLQRHCREHFNDALRSVTGRLIAVRFLAPDDPDDHAGHSGLPKAPPTITRATPDAATRRDALVINPDNTFDHFVIGPGNRFAHAAAIGVADRPGLSFNPLFVYGGVGLGKSHLLQAICLRILDRQPHTNLFYVSCDQFMSEFFEALQKNTTTDFRHKFRDLDILVVDDIHFLAQKEPSQEEFFHTFNALHQAGKQIILSSDASPQDIPLLQARLVSRFKQGMVAEISAPDFETRVAIVRQKASMRAIAFAPDPATNDPDRTAADVAQLIAARIDTNIREIEGVLTRLQMQASLDARLPDLDMVKAILGDAPPPRHAAEPSIHVVIRVVTDFYGVRVTDLQSKRRHRSITVPRQVCMYLARRHTRHSLEEIGGHFGGRDHTTVMHAIDTVESRRKDNPEFNGQVTALDDRVRIAVSQSLR